MLNNRVLFVVAAATLSVSGAGGAVADTPSTCDQSSTTTCAPPPGYELPSPQGGFSLESPPKD